MPSFVAHGTSALSYGAALAFNLTATVLAAYYSPVMDAAPFDGKSMAACDTWNMSSSGLCSAMPHDKQELIFGSMDDLLPQPENPMGRIIIFGARGGDDKSPGKEHRGDTIPMCNSIIERGWTCLPMFYSDAAHDDILRLAEGVDGYISRVNPDVYEGVTQDNYEGLLEELSARGVAAMPHPRFMRLFGSKEALVKIGGLRTGLPDTLMYRDEATFLRTFPGLMSAGPRVLKQNRGSQGEGIWICRLEDASLYSQDEPLRDDAVVIVTEAVDNSDTRHTLASLLAFGASKLQNGGEIVDQAFMPRIAEGEVRVMFIGDKPVEILHKKPKEGGVSATLKSGAVYMRFSPEDPAFARLMRSFSKDIPSLLPSLGLNGHPLPLLWTADFILGPVRPPWSDNQGDYYFVGELNCSCVGITTQLHLTNLVAAEAIKVCEAHRAKRKLAEAEAASQLN